MHQRKAPIKSNSTEGSDKSSLNTLNLKENRYNKEKVAEDKKFKRDVEAYMQNMPETAYHRNTFIDSVQSIVKISES